MKDRTKLYIGIFLLLTATAVGVWQWNEMQANLITADELASEASVQNAIKTNLIGDYQDIKVEVDESRVQALQEVDLVFPTDENLTSLTRLFDDFAVTNNFESNPFFISSINYQDAKDVEAEYRYLPVSLTVDTSSKNLGEFLEFIETSGSLESEVRLMSVEEMTVNYPSEYGGIYNVKFTINAYFSQELNQELNQELDGDE
jgi:hypothetical protein